MAGSRSLIAQSVGVLLSTRMSDLLDRQLLALHRRRRLQRVVAGYVPFLAVTIGIAALLVMVVRLSLPSAAWLVWPIALASFLLPLVLVPRWWSQRDSAVILAGHLDQCVNGQGLVMALAAHSSATRDGDWLARLRQPLEQLTLPPFVYQQLRGVGLVTMCLLVAVMIPQRALAPSLPSVVGSFFQQLSERVAALDEAGIIPHEEAAQQRLDVERLTAHAVDQGMTQATWEGLDRVHQRVDQQTERSVQRLAQAMGLAEATAQPSSSAERQLQEQRLAQAVAELALAAPGLVPRLPKDAGGEELSAVLAQAVQAGALNPEQADAIKKLGLLHPGQAQKLNPAEQKALSEHLKDELAKMREKLSKLGAGEGFDEELRRARDGQGRDGPGRGGVGRGPGHAPLTWDDPLRTKGGGVEGLPAGMQLNPDGSVTIAEQVRDAEIDPAIQAAAQRAAMRAFDPTAADAKRATVAPRHRAVVEKYFANE
jgi:hypothetical protein